MHPRTGRHRHPNRDSDGPYGAANADNRAHVTADGQTSSPTPTTTSPTPTRTATATATATETESEVARVGNTRVTKTPAGAAETGGGGDAGPDGRIFVLAGLVLLLAATTGLLLRRRTPSRG
ncbi:hypothetical protein ACOZ38_23495 [Sphaerisporangium viridialbum]|uniref:hypothetical protein n=1 Tax=Sphaerisporangium viridialbum TaxID=46189 RepID=UPI003C789B5A